METRHRPHSLTIMTVLLFCIVVGLYIGIARLASLSPRTQTEPVEVAAQPSAEFGLRSPVLFDARLSEEEQIVIVERIVRPLTTYALWRDGQSLHSIAVTPLGDEPTSSLQVRYRGKETESISIISREGGVIDWWRPVCDPLCIYPDAFVEQYPEVVAVE